MATTLLHGQETGQTYDVYLFPGQGSDARAYGKVHLPAGCRAVHVQYPVPPRNGNMHEYALSLAQQVDTSRPFVLIGYSLGGMLCTELAGTLNPEKVVLISSAQSRRELPFRYRFMRYVPINRLVPAFLVKAGALLLQPLVEPQRNMEKETFKSMLRAKTPKYLKRTSHLIINWQRKHAPPGIIHIHGDKDHTLPIRHVRPEYTIPGAGHTLILTHPKALNAILEEVLAL